MASEIFLQATASGQEATVDSQGFLDHTGYCTIQSTITGTGSITGTATFTQSIDGLGWFPLATIALAGSTNVSDGDRIEVNSGVRIKATAGGMSANTQLLASIAWE